MFSVRVHVEDYQNFLISIFVCVKFQLHVYPILVFISLKFMHQDA